MAIRAQCRACKKKYNVKDHFAGQTLRCKACGARFRVATVDDFEDYDDEFEEPYDYGRPQSRTSRTNKKRTRKRRFNPTPWIAGAAGFAAVAVVVSVIVVGWNAIRGESDADGDAAPEPGVAAQQPGVAAQEPGIAAKQPGVAAAGSDARFAVATVPVPKFPELVNPIHRFPTGETVYFVELGRVAQPKPGPGSSMKMRVYLPAGQHQPKSLGCVLVAPAGTNLLVGNDMDADDYHDETLPYAKAGMAVVFYSLDGGVRDLERASNAEMFAAYRKFKAACAGVVNGRNALEFVLTKIPQVDPNRIYCAGHSSAATLSLLLAQHEPRIKACIAYAPATDVELRLNEILDDARLASFFPGLSRFLRQSSPKTHVGRFQCPVFLFHARDDSNEPFATTQAYANTMKQSAKKVTFVAAPRGDHYDSMVDQGIPRAIAWLKLLAGASGGSPSQTSRPTTASLQDPTKVNRVTTQTPTAGAPITRGSPVVVFQINSYSGSGDQTAAARQALTRVPWARAETVLIDSATNEIVVGIRGRSVNTGIAKSLLQRAGFKIGSTRYLSRGRR